MKSPISKAVPMTAIVPCLPAHAQSEYEVLLCEAAQTGRVVEIVYHEDASKDCLPSRRLTCRG